MKLFNKIKKWFRRKPKPQPKPMQKGIYFSPDDLKNMMSEHVFTSPLSPVNYKGAPTKPATPLGPVYDTLIEHMPSLKRMLKRVFMERDRDTAVGYYSDGELDPLLIERGSRNDSKKLQISRQATPTVLITKRPGYKRKIDGKYHMQDQFDSTRMVVRG